MTNIILIVIGALILIIMIIVLIMLCTYIGSDRRNDERVADLIMDVRDTQIKSQGEITRQVSESLMNGFALVQGTVNEKLDKSLNERLDSSFKAVGDRLEALYKSLGELRNLESGVNNLNKTLSNVKTRGIFGEMQLGNILANLLDKSQYEENVAIRPRSDERVEYAVKIPDKEDNGYILLPIDSKFPADIYAKIVRASEQGDAELLKTSVHELRDRMKKEAMTIRDKYIAPPISTDFAIMFLPTEGLYAEVLRLDGFVEECQTKYKIVIAGPTTLTAIINSLSVGFKYLTVNKKSEEIVKTLGDFKVQFGRFDELIDQTQKKLEEAQKKTESLAKRSDIIKSRLAKVEVSGTQDVVMDISEKDD